MLKEGKIGNMANDKYRIDSHKLMFHPERTAQWLAAGEDWEKQKKVYPLYVEISPSGSCNHRCSFCAVDYIGYKQNFLEQSVLEKLLSEMAQCGVKSVMFGGEGEPLLMKGLAEAIRFAKGVGLDIGITTNATPLTEKFVETALASISWIKASLNAGNPEAYAKIHGTQPHDFHRVIKNLERAARFKREHGLSTVLGAQAVLIPENRDNVKDLCIVAKDIGLDYVVIKPYSQHLKSVATMEKGYQNFDYSRQAALGEELSRLSDDKFEVIFRANTMRILSEPTRYYSKCQATPNFWAYVMSTGDVYGCSAYLLDQRFCFGNIREQGFREIWEGEQRRHCAELVRETLDIESCRKNCRMEHVNRFLWDLKNPGPHVNFI
jgi:GTP 3',8-cyclase